MSGICDACETVAHCSKKGCVPLVTRAPIDGRQVIFALVRARDQLQAQADRLHDQQDYSAEFAAEDADRMREAIVLLQAKPMTAAQPTGGAA